MRKPAPPPNPMSPGRAVGGRRAAGRADGEPVFADKRVLLLLPLTELLRPLPAGAITILLSMLLGASTSVTWDTVDGAVTACSCNYFAKKKIAMQVASVVRAFRQVSGSRCVVPRAGAFNNYNKYYSANVHLGTWLMASLLLKNGDVQN